VGLDQFGVGHPSLEVGDKLGNVCALALGCTVDIDDDFSFDAVILCVCDFGDFPMSSWKELTQLGKAVTSGKGDGTLQMRRRRIGGSSNFGTASVLPNDEQLELLDLFIGVVVDCIYPRSTSHANPAILSIYEA
jgi:hypothetical protein